MPHAFNVGVAGISKQRVRTLLAPFELVALAFARLGLGPSIRKPKIAIARHHLGCLAPRILYYIEAAYTFWHWKDFIGHDSHKILDF